MKYPLFLSREEIYNGHYSIKKRDATCEFTRDLHYHGYCISFDSSLLLFACSDTSNLFNIFSSCARSGHVRRLTSGQILDLISICRRYETLSMANGRDTGFHSYAHFYRTFKKTTGMSPTEYQKRE